MLAKDLVAAYGDRPVLRNVDLQVQPGEILAVIGLNGAGKSTLLRSLAGLKQPVAGQVLINGVDVYAGHARPNVALVLQGVAIERQLTGLQYLRFAARTRGVGRTTACRLADDVIEDLDLGAFARRRGSELSGGQARRLQLAGSLVRRPDVLLLDEPTSGLDASARRHYWAVIRGLAHRGLGIVAVTHHIDEAGLADEVLLLADGRVESTGSPEQLVGEAAMSVVDIECSDPRQLGEITGALGKYEPERKERVVTVTTDTPGHVLDLIAGLRLPGVDVSTRPASLDDLLLLLAKRGARNE